MRSAEEAGADLRAESWGEEVSGRRPVLLLHGFTGSVEAWGRVPAHLARRRRVLAVDLPGHGRSPLAPDPREHRMEVVHTRLLRTLDRHGVDEAVWIGYSMGGRVALGAGVRHPERVAALVLEGASPGLETEEARRARRRQDEARARRLEEEGLEAFVDRWMALPIFATQRRLPDEVREAERRRRLRGRAAGLAASLRGLGTGSQPSFWDDLGGLERPVLLLTGSEDRKYEALAARMEGELPGARHRSVQGVGHAVHLEAPERWLAAVEGFLAETDRSSPDSTTEE